MAITMFSLGALFAPLHGLFARMAPPRSPASLARRAVDARPAVVRSRGWAPRPHIAAQRRHPGRPLRVFRERADAPSSAVRMAISGSMADVCAELERLAALEAAAH